MSGRDSEIIDHCSAQVQRVNLRRVACQAATLILNTEREIVDALLAVSPEFAEVWRLHEVDVVHHHDLKRYLHPELGELELYGQRLVDPDEGQELLVFSAQPGTPSDEKLQRLITMS